MAAPNELTALHEGQQIIYGGNRVTIVPAEIAATFRSGDRIIVDPTSGAVLHIPASEYALAAAAVTSALDAFASLSHCSDQQITAFFDTFADHLDDDTRFAPIAAANAADVSQARARNRSTSRLELSDATRADMVAGLRVWAAMPAGRGIVERSVDHQGWKVDAVRAPLGVVGFVFEGRPNVFADAAGVVRTGNSVVFRIGSDALGTAGAIVESALNPALVASGLPAGTVQLVASPAHAAGWALFSDVRLSLAVARGSGPAVAQLGAVARQAGVPVSLHGTGGAWMVAAPDADAVRFRLSVLHSLDRKVCNSLNVCCIVRQRATELIPDFIGALRQAADRRGTTAHLHVTAQAAEFLSSDDHHDRGNSDDSLSVTDVAIDRLGEEWEWDSSPEVSLHVVDSVAEAIALCNRVSPRFVATLISESGVAHDDFYEMVDAPFVGDGMTRWVDGQYALDTPELGLSNWEAGRLLARGGILSGDSVYTVRYRAQIAAPDLHR